MLNLSSPTLRFSVSGLRGLWGEDIHPGNVPAIARAFHLSVGRGGIAVARDNRPTGPAMQELIVATLIDLGRSVHTLGIVPTPTIKSYVHSHKLAGGIMVSASHNPVTYNACKFIGKGGFFFDAADNHAWHQHLKNADEWGLYNKQGAVVEDAAEHAIKEHVDQVLEATGLKRKKFPKLRVAIDPGGGCAIYPVRELLRRLGVKVVAIHDEHLDHFPRPPEPVAKALKKLAVLVKKSRSHVGFAYDPDADRLAVVDENGRPIGEEYTLPLVLQQALAQKPSPVVVNLSSSWMNQWVSEQYKQRFSRSSVGEANVVALMQKKRSRLGGEGNGGVIDFDVPSLGRDALSGTAWIIRLLTQQNRKLSQLVADIPRTAMQKTVLHDVRTDELYFRLRKARNQISKQNTQDGLHLAAKDGIPWIHVRPSNTEPVVRLIAEAPTPRALRKLLATANGTP